MMKEAGGNEEILRQYSHVKPCLRSLHFRFAARCRLQRKKADEERKRQEMHTEMLQLRQ